MQRTLKRELKVLEIVEREAIGSPNDYRRSIASRDDSAFQCLGRWGPGRAGGAGSISVRECLSGGSASKTDPSFAFADGIRNSTHLPLWVPSLLFGALPPPA